MNIKAPLRTDLFLYLRQALDVIPKTLLLHKALVDPTDDN